MRAVKEESKEAVRDKRRLSLSHVCFSSLLPISPLSRLLLFAPLLSLHSALLSSRGARRKEERF